MGSRRLVVANEFMLKTLTSISVGWVDFLTILVLCIGFVRGRKRGLSEELLDTLQWLIIVIAGAFFYRQVASILGQRPVLGLLSYYVLSYIIIAMLVKMVFMFIKKHVGQKVVESDMFGAFEYYGGMTAGCVRWSCMYLFAISLLHAPYYSPEALAARKKAVEYNYGSDFFPSINKIQADVFKTSLTGRGAQQYLAILLLAPASNESRSLRSPASGGQRRERDIDAIMRGK
jgi:uncharacterized membrane protein required for colicin V production